MGIVHGVFNDEGPGEAETEVLLRHPKVHWEGWGCSLAWCGKALGNAPQVEAWADLLYTMNDVEVGRLWPGSIGSSSCPKSVPGLGLTIARYNVGGVGGIAEGAEGQARDPQSRESRSHKSRGWYAEIEGFQPGEGSDFDWERDPSQRRFLALAVERGADYVELFANAPMWWMTDSKSSFGGQLVRPNAFAVYLAEVAAYARSSWHLPVKSVSPFNEPSAGWWKFPHNQEGCNIPAAQQAQFIVKLRGELNRLGLEDVIIATSDENTPSAALSTWNELRNTAALGCVGRLNVHAYDGLKPWKEATHPSVRSVLRRKAKEDGLPLWMSEHGNGEVEGLGLAQTILEDLCHLQATAWCYWQLVEHKCSWGFVEADFNPEGTVPTALPHPKYYVFAHFSRFLRPGMEILQCVDCWAVAGYAEEEACLVCVLVNAFSGPCKQRLRFTAFSAAEQEVKALFTQPREARYFAETTARVQVAEPDGGAELLISVNAPPMSICSLRVPGARRRPPAGAATVTKVRAMARYATLATSYERLTSETDVRIAPAWHRLDHCFGSADAALEAQAVPAEVRERELNHLKQMVVSAAKGAANERKRGSLSGSGHPDTQTAWGTFHVLRKKYAFDDDLDWLMFNTCWAEANEAFLGANDKHSRKSKLKVAEHFSKLDPDALVLPRRVFPSPEHVPSAPRWVAFIRHAQAGHNIDEKLVQHPDNPLTEAGTEQATVARAGPAGDAIRAADLVITSPLMRAVQTTSVLLGAREDAVPVKVEALQTEAYSVPCDDGTAKSELLGQLPPNAASWEGWEELPEVWWPGPSDDVEARVEAFRQAVRNRTEERIVFMGHGCFWKKLLGRYLDNCDVVYCDRLLTESAP